MIGLRDRIVVLTAGTKLDRDGDPAEDWTNPVKVILPAYVGDMTTIETTGAGSDILHSSLTAITVPYEFTGRERINWRGKQYILDGAGCIHRKGATDHHTTIKFVARV